MAITRTALVDDSGQGTDGTILNNAWKTELYDQIDDAIELGATAVACQAYNSAVQSVPTATYTTLTLDSETLDTDGFHSTVTNNSRVTIPTGFDGWYLVNARTTFYGNAVSQYVFRIRKNGSSTIMADAWPTAFWQVEMTGLFHFAAGDYLELQGYHDRGSNENIGNTGGSGGETMITVFLLARP